MGANSVWETPAEKITRRLSRYSEAKRDVLKFCDWLGEEFNGTHLMQLELEQCGTYQEWRIADGEDDSFLHASNFCGRHLLCRLCSIRRAARFMAKYAAKIFGVIEARKFSDRLLFLTFTVKDGPDLIERLAHLRCSMSRLLERWRKTRANRRGYSSSLAAVHGGVWTVEVKRGNGSGAWHPHVHAVVASSQRVNFAALQAEWESITGDSKFVKAKHLRSYLAFSAGGMSIDEYRLALLGDLREVFKYVLKLGEMSNEDVLEAAARCKGSRMVAGFGSFWGVKTPSLLDDRDWQGIAFTSLVYKYAETMGRFIQVA